MSEEVDGRGDEKRSNRMRDRAGDLAEIRGDLERDGHLEGRRDAHDQCAPTTEHHSSIAQRSTSRPIPQDEPSEPRRPADGAKLVRKKLNRNASKASETHAPHTHRPEETNPISLLEAATDAYSSLKIAMRPKNAAKALDVSERWLWSQVQLGRIPHAKIGGVILIPVTELVKALAAEVKRTKKG